MLRLGPTPGRPRLRVSRIAKRETRPCRPSPRPPDGRPSVRGSAPRCLTRQSHGSGPSSQPSFTSLPAAPPPLEPPSRRPLQNIESAKGGDARCPQRRIRPYADGEDSTPALRSRSEYRFSRANGRTPASRTAFCSASLHGSFLARSIRAVLRGLCAMLHGQAEIAAAFPP